MKFCDTVLTLQRVLVPRVLVQPEQALVFLVPVLVPEPVPEPVQVPPLWGALPVSSAHNRPLTKTALRTSA
jgi:hypothetical protein